MQGELLGNLILKLFRPDSKHKPWQSPIIIHHGRRRLPELRSEFLAESMARFSQGLIFQRKHGLKVQVTLIDTFRIKATYATYIISKQTRSKKNKKMNQPQDGPYMPSVCMGFMGPFFTVSQFPFGWNIQYFLGPHVHLSLLFDGGHAVATKPVIVIKLEVSQLNFLWL